MSALEHLLEARSHLLRAEEQAGTGTQLMIQPIREDLDGLIETTENIEDHGDNSNQDS